MTRHLWLVALAGVASVGVSTLPAAEPRDFLSGLYVSERQPAWFTPVVDVGGIIDNALRGNVPGIINNAVPPRYQGHVWGYYPWQNYLPRGAYGYAYPQNGAAYPYYGAPTPAYPNNNSNYDYRYADPNYGAARPSAGDPANPASPSIVVPSADTPANPSAGPAAASERAKVVNPAENGVTLSFMVDSQVYTVAPGAHQEVLGGPDRVVSFDRGDARGTGRYSLRAGTYTFTATGKGWELYHTEPESRQAEVIPPPPVPTLPQR